MKNDATFVRMRSGDHLGDAKMSEKGTSLNERGRADLQNVASDFF